jgi:hypothetical protein
MNWSLVPEGGPVDEAEAVYGRADHWGFVRARAGWEDSGSTPQARDQRGDLLQLEEQVRRQYARLKKLLADLMLDNAALKDLLSKVVTRAVKREAVAPSTAAGRDERAIGRAGRSGACE